MCRKAVTLPTLILQQPRIKEFKEMVMALHKAGIRVIFDAVYNHTFDINGSNFPAYPS